MVGSGLDNFVVMVCGVVGGPCNLPSFCFAYGFGTTDDVYESPFCADTSV